MSTEYKRIRDDLVGRVNRQGSIGFVYPALVELLEHLDQQALESVIFRRVAGDAICGGCGAQYKTHPNDEEFPFLVRACLGQLVKL